MISQPPVVYARPHSNLIGVLFKPSAERAASSLVTSSCAASCVQARGALSPVAGETK